MNIKNKLQDLAVFGGPKTFIRPLHVGQINIGNRQRLLERINGALDRKWLTNDGPYVQEFEKKIAHLVKVKHCIATCNATIGLQVVLRALELSGEVILPSLTFIATAHALQWAGIRPVFCDIDPQTWNIDPLQIEKLITPKTTAIMGVHLFGRPCAVITLAEIARKRKLKLIYDAAHAFGCSIKGRMIGGFGDAEVFSFHATKFVNSLEGGAIVTNSDALANKARLMRNFGFAGYDKVVCLGINGKMNEFQAAMGLTSLESLKQFIKANYNNYKQYQKELAALPGVSVMGYNEEEKCNFQFIILEINEAKTHLSRDAIAQVLWAENVLARRYFYPGCHRLEPYLSFFPHTGAGLYQTERMAGRLLCLPTGTNIGKKEINKLSMIIRFSVAHAAKISHMLSKR